jgi:eukaryotic-like serine/threonine-protein kinase
MASPIWCWSTSPGAPSSSTATACRLDIDQRLALFLTVCSAVEHAHRNLIVHRDLKPSNILVGDDGQVKLLDFGIAKMLEAGGARTATAARTFTPEYAAPEQVRGDPVTTSVDVHALGLLLFELLSGERPYAAGASDAGGAGTGDSGTGTPAALACQPYRSAAGDHAGRCPRLPTRRR